MDWAKFIKNILNNKKGFSTGFRIRIFIVNEKVRMEQYDTTHFIIFYQDLVWYCLCQPATGKRSKILIKLRANLHKFEIISNFLNEWTHKIRVLFLFMRVRCHHWCRSNSTARTTLRLLNNLIFKLHDLLFYLDSS